MFTMYLVHSVDVFERGDSITTIVGGVEWSIG